MDNGSIVAASAAMVVVAIVVVVVVVVDDTVLLCLLQSLTLKCQSVMITSTCVLTASCACLKHIAVMARRTASIPQMKRDAVSSLIQFTLSSSMIVSLLLSIRTLFIPKGDLSRGRPPQRWPD